ncbi:MAG TPA: hypothetical protein VN625_03555 [Desulfuromonadaceae bacterium]|nr:hypothetical protein [Desulfuromonadaceae bacterium]
MTLDGIRRNDFEQCVGEQFQIELGGKVITARLAAVTGLGFKSEGQQERESFTLLFHGPNQYRYPQGIYRVSHPKLGSLEIFLVPLGPDEKGMQLEAVFNFV